MDGKLHKKRPRRPLRYVIKHYDNHVPFGPCLQQLGLIYLEPTRGMNLASHMFFKTSKNVLG
jgi:hypothetical protein